MMRTTRSYLAAALLAALGCSSSGEAMGRALAATGTAAADLRAVLSAPRLDLAAVDRLYGAAVLANGVEALHRRVDDAARAGEPAARTRAVLVKAALLWRGGDLPAARQAVAAIADGGGDALLLRARLADAAGEVDLLMPYRAALAAGAGGDAVRLRLAVIEGMAQPSDLVRFAAGLPPARARPIAVVLGLLGDPAAALKLYVPATAGAEVVPDLLRMADWALAARDWPAARERSWQAYRAATVEDDRRYALALLTEAYRDAGDLAGADTFLAGKPQDADVRRARLNLLMEMGRYDAAVKMASAPDAGPLRDRLPAILNLTGKRGDRIEEYRRLIATQPHDPRWYGALAAICMQDGDEAGARAVYDRFFTANRTDVSVIIEGGRQMIALGLGDAAIAMAERVAATPGGGIDARRFLFDTYVARGDVAHAGEQLQAMRAALPAGSPVLAQVAEGYATIGRRDDAIATLQALEDAARAPDYDREVRLSELLVQADRPDEALARLRRLLPATQLPARRSLIENRIVEVANASGNTDAIATALERRLDAGALGEDQISLLMALRLSQKKYDEATAIMRRFVASSGGGEAARLRQLVPVYSRMNKLEERDAALDRLAQIDPANRAGYLRNRILGVVDREDPAPSSDRVARIDRLLAALETAEGAHATHGFRAGIYGMAGLDDRALAETRAALAAEPRSADALAQLVAAMKKVGQVRESLALLQFEAEAATSTASFVGVVDAMLDALVDADPALSDVMLDWAERRVVERIATAGADGGLIGRLTDLADLRADDETQLRAVEASLPNAGELRASVLRQLVTMTAGSASDGQAPTFGDVRRRITYGRRLLALERLFPPTFYGDLGEAMLSVGDVAGAEGAFAMMSDMGSVLNVDAIRGDAYARRGYTDAALRTFVSAMLRDQNNYDLVIKASILREQNGQGALAFPWYWRSLRAVIRRQPVLSRDAASDNAVDVEQVVPNLLEGMLLTWPTDPVAGAQVMREWRAMLDEAVARIGTPRPLEEYGRLRLIVQLGRRIAAVRGDAALAAANDAAVARLPGGTPAADAPPVQAGPVGRAIRQARENGNMSLEVAGALGSGDSDALQAIVRAAMAREEQARTHPTEYGPGEGAGAFIMVLMDLVERLPPDRVRSLLIAPLQASKFRDDILFALLNVLPDRYALLQKIAGRPLLTDDELVTMAVERSFGGTGFTLRDVRRSETRPFSWIAALSPARQIAIYDGLVTQAERGRGSSMLATEALRDLLTSPLDPALQPRLLAVMRRDIAVARNPEVHSARFIMRNLLILDAPPANRPVVLAGARMIAERFADGRLLPDVLTAWYAGDRTAAYRLLIELARQSDAKSFADFSVPLIKQYFVAERQARIDAFMNNAAPTAGQAQQFYIDFVATNDDADDATIIGYYRKLLSVEPDNAQYTLALLAKLWGRGDRDGFAALLRDYLHRHGDNRGAATVLAFADLVRGNAAEARALAAANGFSLDDPAWVTRMLNRAGQRGGAAGDPAAMFGPVYAVFEQANPDAPVVLALQKRAGTAARRATGTVEEQAVSQFVEVALRDPAAAAGALRSLWRRSAVPGAEASSWNALSREPVVAALGAARSPDGGPQAAKLRAVMARPDVTAELEAETTVVDPLLTAVSEPLYTWLVDGIEAQGAAGTRLDALIPEIRDGSVTAPGLRLATRLADGTGRALDPAALQALAQRLDAAPVLSIRDRIAAARVFARGGDTATANAMLRAATLQLLYPGMGAEQKDADAIAAAFSVWADRAAAGDAYAGIARLFADRQLAAAIAPKVTLPPAGAPATAADKAG